MAKRKKASSTAIANGTSSLRSTQKHLLQWKPRQGVVSSSPYVVDN